ncbi:hypothetical protein Pelo_2467 [Pelomyxa schiedti]|nr:hypothetical protein Pelo_2467 [Pelomyxa schiedti]
MVGHHLWLVLGVALVTCFSLLSSGAETPNCGPDATSWFTRQMDYMRTRSGQGWLQFTRSFDAVMSPKVDNTTGYMSFLSALKKGPPTTSTCPTATSESCNRTATVCGKCLSVNTLALIALGYTASNATGVALWGAIFEKQIKSNSDAAAVMIGVYLRSRTPAVCLNVDRTCILLNGEYGNMMPSFSPSGLTGDITAQDQLWGLMHPVTVQHQVLPTWETETGLHLDTLSAWLATSMAPETMGKWLDLVQVPSETCSPCSSTSTWLDYPVWSASSPRVDGNETNRTVEDIATVNCTGFPLTSPSWSSCVMWTLVTYTMKMCGMISNPPNYTSIVWSVCWNSQVSAYMALQNILVTYSDPCVPASINIWNNVMTTALNACNPQEVADVFQPMISLPQIICAANYSTGQTGSQCFKQLIQNVVDQGTQFDFLDFPMCTACVAEILNKENMGIVYDFECSYHPAYNYSCYHRLYDVWLYSLADSIPSTCLLMLTGMGKVPSEYTHVVSSTCKPILDKWNEQMGCCSPLLNRMLGTALYITHNGVDSEVHGFSGPPCVQPVLNVSLSISGLILSEDKSVSDNVLHQMSEDEIAHFVPALLKPEYINHKYPPFTPLVFVPPYVKPHPYDCFRRSFYCCWGGFSRDD